jgi:hypothetical protein
MTNKLNFFLISILVLFIFFGANNISKNSHQQYDSFKIETDNLVNDGSFENFSKSPGDCCNNFPGEKKIYASQSKEAILGNYSLNLTSISHCACIAKKIEDLNISSKYYISTYYKGDNPRIYLAMLGPNSWEGDHKFDSTEKWIKHQIIISKISEDVKGVSVGFHSSSNDGLPKSNLYDALQVNKLVQIQEPFNYQKDEEYIIKTKTYNKVNGEQIESINSEIGEVYFLITGEPKVTIKFPLTELIIILMILIIIGGLRLTKHEKH